LHSNFKAYRDRAFADDVADMFTTDDHGIGNGTSIPIGNPMGMGIDDAIGNGNRKEWESPCMGMGMGMALILMEINLSPDSRNSLL